MEQFFRQAKDLLETRPIFHKYQATIAGHNFVSFPVLVVRHEICVRLEKRGHDVEWADVLWDLTEAREVEVCHRGKDCVLRLPLPGVAGKVFQAVGVAVPHRCGRPFPLVPRVSLPPEVPYRREHFKTNCRRWA